MAALASAAEIPPGGEAEIEATVNTRGRSGPLKKAVTVETNDPQNRVLRLMLKGTVVVDAALEPSRLSLGEMSKGDRVTKVAVLKARDPGKVRLTGVEVVPDDGDISARLTKVDGADAVEVAYEAREIGRVRGQVKVSTTSETQEQISLWVSGEVAGNWRLIPRTVSFPEPEEGAPAERTLKVVPRAEKGHRITGGRDPEGAVSARVEKAGDGWNVVLSLSADSETRRGTVEISTTDPDEPSLTVRYFVRRSAARKLPPRGLKGVQPRRPAPR